MRISELNDLVFGVLCGETEARDALKQWLDAHHGREKELSESGLTLVLDRTVRISPAALLVPGLSPYRPLAVAIGVPAVTLPPSFLKDQIMLYFLKFSACSNISASARWRRW